MLKKAALVKQIYVTVTNEVGVLNRMADFLADRGINIEAVAGYEMTGTDKAKVMLVVDDTRRATDLLKQKGFTALEEREEILVELENKPGSLKSVTSILAAKGINIKQIYGSMSSEKSPVRVVMATSDNQTAIVTLKKAAVR
ncbi:MAG TPA: ACT domain-containing protein [Syntrophales bacterium]|nr:ACT domain-containing protein [Syntrophales bacterium]